MSQPARGQLAAIVSVLCAAVMIAMLLGHGWLTLGVFGEGGIGPRGIEACVDGTCTSYWWGDVPINGALPALAIVALGTGLAAFAFTVTCGGFALARRPQHMPHRSARVIIALAIASSAGFLVALATNTEVAKLTAFEIASVGPGGVVALAAMCIAWFGTHRLAKHTRVVAAPPAFAPMPLAPQWQQPQVDGWHPSPPPPTVHNPNPGL